MNSYELSRNFWDWCFENPELISPNHSALYFFIIEHNNRLGWKSKFGLPMEMAKNAIGIKNYRTYSKTFNDLIDWGFIEILQRSKNQYSSNIIALVKNTKASTKALDRAIQKHSQKQVHGIVGIDKPINLITNNTSLQKNEVKERASFSKSEKEEIEEQFELFFKHYHEITKIKKTDKKAALEYFKKLSLKERRLAYVEVKNYFKSLKDTKYCKKARTYLSDRNFEDEFESNSKFDFLPEETVKQLQLNIKNRYIRVDGTPRVFLNENNKKSYNLDLRKDYYLLNAKPIQL